MSDRRPRIGILGIMQDLYDDMIPGIARRQEGYAAELAASLADVGEFIPGKVVKYREDAERVMREFEDSDLDGVLVVMLTYGPAMRVARLLAESRLPICLANIQPEPAVTAAWDMADMTYNQGVPAAPGAGDALRPVPADLRAARMPERMAGRGRAAPRGHEPRPPRGVMAGVLPAHRH
jgi:L-arabinose isomerase